MNIFCFIGRIGRDAEVRYSQSGSAVCSFAVAVKSGYGERQKTNWIKCVMFGKKAEGQLPQYLKKGTQVAVSGECYLEEWEGQNGKGAAIAVNVANIDLIGGKPQEQAQPQARQAPPSQPAPPPQGQPMGVSGPAPSNNIPDDPFSDPIPF